MTSMCGDVNWFVNFAAFRHQELCVYLDSCVSVSTLIGRQMCADQEFCVSTMIAVCRNRFKVVVHCDHSYSNRSRQAAIQVDKN